MAKTQWKHTTVCLNCGRTLTTTKGWRIRSAIWDSGLPQKKKMTQEKKVKTIVETTWARCEICYAAAKVAKKEEENGKQ